MRADGVRYRVGKQPFRSSVPLPSGWIIGAVVLFLLLRAVPVHAQSEAGGGGRRNPFAAPGRGSTAMTKSEFTFGKAEKVANENVRWSYVPRISVNGMMKVRGRYVITADIEGLGNRVLKPGDKIILPAAVSKEGEKSAWFTVKNIGREHMTIGLDDGSLIHGKLF